MQPGIWQILIVAVVILVLFGRGRISEMMGDFGKGVSSFKKGLSEDDAAKAAKPANPAQIAHENTPASETAENAPADKTST